MIAGHARLPRRGPVARDPDGLRLGVYDAVSHTRRPEGFTEDAAGGMTDVVKVADLGQGLVQLNQRRLSKFEFAARAVGTHPRTGLHDRGDDPCGATVLSGQWPVVQVHPDLLGLAMAVQRQFLVAIGQGAARQADLHDVVVEFRDLGPALSNIGAEQLRMPPAGEGGIGVIVDHHAFGTPEHDDRHGRRDRQSDRRLQALWPARYRTQGRRAPVVRADAIGHLARRMEKFSRARRGGRPV